MAFPLNLIQTLLFFFSLLHLSLAAFTPTDNYLINSGSSTNTSFFTIRSFLSDSSKPGSSFLSTDRSISISDPNPSPDSPALYNTARVFPIGGSYKFQVTTKGTHFIRLHFAPFKASSFNLRSAKFRVLINGFSVINSFSTSSVVVKEFILKIDDPVLEISFIPSKASGFGFVNAVEVFSAPNDYIMDQGTKLVIPNSAQIFSNLSSQVLETVHRINVGGSKLTPFNDTLWRTWVVDDNFLLLRAAARRAWTTHSPNYQSGGATREIAPDNVYMTAQEMDRDNQELQARFNISWGFQVDEKRVLHLVRLHFCDIVSSSLNQLYFNVFINEYLAYKDVDLSTLTFHVLASPLYIDFVAESDRSGMLRISVGPSDLSNPARVNALLNGVEIMRILSPVSSEVVSGKRNVVWIVVGSVLGGFVFLSLFFLCVLCLCRRKNNKTRSSESTGWTPLRRFRGSSNSRTTERTVSSSGYHTLRISFAELQSGTNNFDKSLVIGVGGFGMVFKGPAVDPLLVREQVNLAEWAIEWQRKGMLDQIVDPNIADEIKPCSLKKFAETAEKCCADYGVDRPTIGDVLWNLEHVLQLQESGPLNNPEEVYGDVTDSGTARQGPSSGSNTDRDYGDGTSGIISSSQVFSQLMTNAGR
ncbi:unnamed protein product [Arabidopsis arenosa]|uniref:Malectin-like domain-containing protein n=1 Tax=Arabidopsis arenosa TaxID=38785 RepID=A0A8S2ARN2_ARAAE|nr:unnamed protein product [Arabidopsis arenosa]